MSEVTPVLTTIADLKQHVGQPVTLRGWLYNLRSSGKLLFPTFRDGTGTVQGIVPKAAVPEQVFDTLKSLTLESSLTVTGTVREDQRAPSGVELDVSGVTVTQRIPEETPYPISRKEHGVDFLMEHRHLWLRTPRQSAILRVRAAIMRAAAEYFDINGFIRTDPPILTPNACEGTSDLFEMKYFDEEMAYLTQSGQLYVEATALALGKVYSFGPTFRAEKSKTRRHLTEFWMIEPEEAYLDLDGLMTLAENFLTHIVTRVLESHRADLAVIGRDITKLEAIATPGEYPKLTYDEAHAMLDSRLQGRQTRKPAHLRRRLRLARRNLHLLAIRQARHGAPLSRRHQGLLHGARPEGPYQGPLRRRARPRRLRRNHRRLAAHRRLQPPQIPHRVPQPPARGLPVVPRPPQVRQRPSLGFGMGIERCVAWICGLEHVRETIPFARTLNRIYP